jgi:hypothetical protein
MNLSGETGVNLNVRSIYMYSASRKRYEAQANVKYTLAFYDKVPPL